MDGLDSMLQDLMKNPEFKREYDALRPERDITKAMVEARRAHNMTQAELSERSGVSQADISRLENGTRNPSIALLQRIAAALDSTLHIEFVPNQHTN